MQLSDDEIRRRLDAVRRHETIAEAARELGIGRSTLSETVTNSSFVASADPVEQRKLKDQITILTKERDEALRRAIAAEDVRSGLLNLPPPLKSAAQKPQKVSKGSRSVILHLSDVHYAETISLSELDGVNSYSVPIADRRLRRLFETVCSLLTEHWKGAAPEHLHLCLGGDMVSGAIHAELSRTDGMTRLLSARTVAARIAEGVQMIRSQVKCPVSIYSVPGNHGRLSLKPEHKGTAVDSLDTLVAWFIEDHLRSDLDVNTFYGDSIDCVFSLYDRDFLLTHGDRMGSKGGAGFVGPIATILRGHMKLYSDYADRGQIIYRMLTGHFHSTARLPLGYANGSVAGWSDFARDLRARKEPASQNMLVVHSEKGVIGFHEIQPGSSDEGSIYRGV